MSPVTKAKSCQWRLVDFRSLNRCCKETLETDENNYWWTVSAFRKKRVNIEPQKVNIFITKSWKGGIFQGRESWWVTHSTLERGCRCLLPPPPPPTPSPPPLHTHPLHPPPYTPPPPRCLGRCSMAIITLCDLCDPCDLVLDPWVISLGQ